LNLKNYFSFKNIDKIDNIEESLLADKGVEKIEDKQIYDI
jgi:hypothetical protein